MIRQLCLLITCSFFSIDCSKYCQKQYQCGNQIHTMCLRGCGPSSACGEHFQAMGMDEQTRKLVVDLHNEKRNEIALGRIRKGGNSQASNMHELVYDEELEEIAQCWANNCIKGGFKKSVHDSCRITEQFSSVGQNLYLLRTNYGNFTNPYYIKSSILDWYKEIKCMDRTIIDNFHETNCGIVGHLTQMIWAKTTHIGCGRTKYGHGNNFNFLFICNYGIGGNILEAPVYKRGKPCSQCGKAGCSSRYKGLCATKDSNSSDNSTVIRSVFLNMIVLITIGFNYLMAFLKHILSNF